MWGRKKTHATGGFAQLADSNRLGDVEHMLSAFPSSSLGGYGELAASPSLKELVKKRLLNDMITGFANEPAGMVLLVDHFTMRIVSSSFRMSELLEHNINLIENITMRVGCGADYLQRQPLPLLTAIYFITPTIESLNRLITDYRKTKHPMSAPTLHPGPASFLLTLHSRAPATLHIT